MLHVCIFLRSCILSKVSRGGKEDTAHAEMLHEPPSNILYHALGPLDISDRTAAERGSCFREETMRKGHALGIFDSEMWMKKSNTVDSKMQLSVCSQILVLYCTTIL